MFSIVLFCLCVVIMITVNIYNTLTKGRILMQESFNGMNTYLKQRNDLVFVLVEAVKSHVGRDNPVLWQVMEWRNRSMHAADADSQNQAMEGLDKALPELLALATSCPALKGDADFRRMKRKMETVEENINYARRYYNSLVREYNQRIAVFPGKLVAGSFGFRQEAFFHTQ